MIHNIAYLLVRAIRFMKSVYSRYCREIVARQVIYSIDPDRLTFYPREMRKSKKQIQSELKSLIIGDCGAWNEIDTVKQYFYFGCDRSCAKIEDYVFQKEYDKVRDSLNGDLVSLYKYKTIAGVYLRARGINASCSIGRISEDGKNIKLLDGSLHHFEEWLQTYSKPIFCKPDDGNQGISCFRVEWDVNNSCLLINEQSVKNAKDTIKNLIVEPLIIQCADLRSISPNCVNPLRIRTMCIDGEVRYVSTYICIAPEKSYFSNAANCGVAIGINRDGQCLTDGFCEVVGQEGRYQILPNTQLRIKELVIPGVREAINLALAAHRTTPEIYAIGWDIALTDEGPIIIEGNPRYGSCTYQAISGIGERAFFEEEFKKNYSKI